MRKLLLALAMGAVFASPVFAGDYTCEMRDIDNGFTPEAEAPKFDPDAISGVMYDALIHIFHII